MNVSNIDFSIENHESEFCKSAGKTGLDIASVSWKNLLMENVQSEEILQEFGKRIQRCYGCFVSYYLKDMYLGEDVTFFCEHCKDDSMFHFNEFSKLLDIAKLREVEEDHHH